jgi:cytochrome P450
LIYFRDRTNQYYLIPTTPKALAEVLVHNSYDFEKPPPVRSFLSKVLGDGLIVVEGSQHKFQRKNLLPAFHTRHIKELYPLFWTKANVLAEALIAAITPPYISSRKDGQVISGVVEIGDWADRVSMDIIGLAALGRDMNTIEDPRNEVLVHFKDLLEPTTEKAVYFVLHMLFPHSLIKRIPWVLQEPNRILNTGVSRLRNIGRDMVRDKSLSQKNGTKSDIDILSILLRTESFADENLVDQLLTFLAAGYASLISSSFYSLLKIS